MLFFGSVELTGFPAMSYADLLVIGPDWVLASVYRATLVWFPRVRYEVENEESCPAMPGSSLIGDASSSYLCAVTASGAPLPDSTVVLVSNRRRNRVFEGSLVALT